MSVIVNDIITLGQECNSADVRTCVIDGIKHAGVVKLIQAISGTGESGAKMAWSRMKERNADIEPLCKVHNFGGRTGDVVVADASTLMKIIFKLKGDRAQAFRESSMKSFLEVLNPTREFVEALQDRLAEVEDGEFDIDNVLVTYASRAPRAYGETSVYVRVRLPSEHTTTTVANFKEITMDIMKFGVTYNKQGRHSVYSKDNGYFAFAFTLRSRNEADFVENYIKSTFGKLTVLNSREYLDARRLAAALGLEYDGVDYEAYLVVARTLFVKMVEFAKLVYPGAYDGMYGTLYSVVETMNDLATADDIAAPTRLSFTADTITRDLAAQFGFRNPEITWLPVCTNPDITSLPVPVNHETTSLPIARTKSNGKVIARDLVTGVEETFESVTAAATRIGYTAKSLLRCVDAHRQMAGKHWRTEGKLHWVPPKGLQIVLAGREGVLHYVRGTAADGTSRVYENPTVAALHQGVIARSITQSATAVTPHLGVQWSWVEDQELNTMADGVDTCHLVTVITLDRKEGASGRCHGKVIQRDILTGEETVCKSASYAARMNIITKAGEGFNMTVTPKMMKDELVDKTRPANGRTFRSLEATQRWEPPSYYKRDPRNVVENWPNSSKNGKAQPWIVATDPAGRVLAMYETKLAAARIEGIPYDTIKTACDTGTVRHDRVWRSAREEEYGVFVPCEPFVESDSE